jgi:hypothetical protein
MDCFGQLLPSTSIHRDKCNPLSHMRFSLLGVIFVACCNHISEAVPVKSSINQKYASYQIITSGIRCRFRCYGRTRGRAEKMSLIQG